MGTIQIKKVKKTVTHFSFLPYYSSFLQIFPFKEHYFPNFFVLLH